MKNQRESNCVSFIRRRCGICSSAAILPKATLFLIMSLSWPLVAGITTKDFVPQVPPIDPPALTVQELVDELLGPSSGASVSSVTLTGDDRGAGTFAGHGKDQL